MVRPSSCVLLLAFMALPACEQTSHSGPGTAPSPNDTLIGSAENIDAPDANQLANAMPPVSAQASLEELVAAHNGRVGGCAECSPREALASAEAQVPHGEYTHVANPTCQNQVDGAQEISRIVDTAAAAYSGNYAGAAQSLAETEAARRFISDNIHGTLGRLLSSGRSDTAMCQSICAVVPARAVVSGYRMEAANEDRAFAACNAGQDCSVGWSRWIGEPIVSTGQHSRTVCGVFANWAHQGHRYARLRVFFQPPDSWIPPR